MIVYGWYRFWRRISGCRNDYCNKCGKEVLAQQWRAFIFGHIFFIPLIPLGFHTWWICPDCQNNPRARYETGRGMKITGVIVFGLIFIATLFMPYSGEDVIEYWVFRVISLAIAVWIAYSLTKHQNVDPMNRQQRQRIIPINNNCPFCSGVLAHYPYLQCPRCKIKIYQD